MSCTGSWSIVAGLLRTTEEVEEEGKQTDDAELQDLLTTCSLCYAMNNRKVLNDFKEANGMKRFLFRLLCRESFRTGQSGSSKASQKAIEVFQA